VIIKFYRSDHGFNPRQEKRGKMGNIGEKETNLIENEEEVWYRDLI
jgi:hypothetical protein